VIVDYSTERWLPVPEWEGFYEVSDLGRVRNLRSGRLLSPALRKDGYQHVSLKVNGSRDDQLVHRLVMLAFTGPCPDDMETRHLDGNPASNTLANLKYGTSSENSFDTVHHGRNQNANKTHCKRRHEYTPANTYEYGGRRYCRACHKITSTEWARQKRTETAA
jgi:hypothetical protein